MQIREPEVSVVIPCRDHAVELVRCLRSVRAQEFDGSLEVIVVDAGLDDAIASVAGENVVVVRGREALRPGAARNLGAAGSQGRWLCFIDADCVAESGWVAAAVRALNTGARVVGGAVLQAEPWHPIATIDNLMQFSDLAPGRPAGPATVLPGCNAAISRRDFDSIGGFPVIDFPAGEDVLFFENATERWPGSVRFVPPMRVRHHGRGTLRALWAHQDSFGYARARYGLQLTATHRWLGRSALLLPLLGLRRVGYLAWRAVQWNPRSLVALVLGLPVLAVGMTAWCRGFHRGCEVAHSATVPMRGTG